ncbi:MAG: DUF3135 domain-containing protein [Pseudomonadota bacterium]
MTTRLPEFDELVDLARNEPQQLETLRQTLINEVIGSASSDEQRRRLEGLQFKVDMERRRAASPLAATIKISEMMCQSLADLHRSLITPLEESIEPLAEARAEARSDRTSEDVRGPVAAGSAATPASGAKILPFTRAYAAEADSDDLDF